MDDLNNSQLVLLIILISFVTSIATSIMTTALLDNAPVSVTHSVNRIVERTVERVIPGEDIEVERVIEEKVTVIERDQAITTVKERWQAYSIKLFRDNTFITRGLFDPESQTIITPRELSGIYQLRLENSDHLGQAETLSSGNGPSYSVLKPDQETIALLPSQPINVADQTTPGSSVIHIGGRQDLYVADGRLTRVTTDNLNHRSWEVNFSLPDNQPGSLLVSFDHKIIGLLDNSNQKYRSVSDLYGMIKSAEEGMQTDPETRNDSPNTTR